MIKNIKREGLGYYIILMEEKKKISPKVREHVKKTCILSKRVRLGFDPPPWAVSGHSDFMQFFFKHV